MNDSVLGIMDLPDEIILIIWNKLSKIDVLYSFVGVNKRFNKLVRDPIYTRSIQLTITNKYSSLPHSIIDRFCLDILPQIDQCIEHLILEPMSMERILLSTDYLRLRKLTFTKISEDFVLRHFNDQSPLINLFKYQIEHLIITIDRKRFTSLSYIDLGKNFLTRIFNIFLNLIYLDLNENNIEGRTLISIYGLSSIDCYSSNLVCLSISVNTFDDCLCLLDGRFHRLRKLSIVIQLIDNSTLTVESLKGLSNMKCFSLTSYRSTKEYDSHIVPLIRQMKYLEELTLSLSIDRRPTFIDGNALQNEILVYLEEMFMSSNNDLRRTFFIWKYGNIVCYSSRSPINEIRSHIFSLPCIINDIYIINNQLPHGGLYRNVRILYLSDRNYPFKHEFFLRIARAFPLVTHVTLLNSIHNDVEENNDQISTIVQFNHLISLTIHFQREAYIEQFLLDTKTYLPNLINLTVSYNNLVTVTNNFTRHSTRRNCSKVQTLKFTIFTITVHEKEFYLYFPSLE